MKHAVFNRSGSFEATLSTFSAKVKALDSVSLKEVLSRLLLGVSAPVNEEALNSFLAKIARLFKTSFSEAELRYFKDRLRSKRIKVDPALDFKFSICLQVYLNYLQSVIGDFSLFFKEVAGLGGVENPAVKNVLKQNKADYQICSNALIDTTCEISLIWMFLQYLGLNASRLPQNVPHVSFVAFDALKILDNNDILWDSIRIQEVMFLLLNVFQKTLNDVARAQDSKYTPVNNYAVERLLFIHKITYSMIELLKLNDLRFGFKSELGYLSHLAFIFSFHSDLGLAYYFCDKCFDLLKSYYFFEEKPVVAFCDTLRYLAERYNQILEGFLPQLGELDECISLDESDQDKLEMCRYYSSTVLLLYNKVEGIVKKHLDAGVLKEGEVVSTLLADVQVGQEHAKKRNSLISAAFNRNQKVKLEEARRIQKELIRCCCDSVHEAFSSDHLSCCERILEDSGPDNSKDDKGYALIHKIIKNRKLSWLFVAIKFDLDVNIKTKTHQTALHIAVLNHDARAVELLLGAGAESSSINKAKKTPVDYARPLAVERKSDVILRMLLGDASPAPENMDPPLELSGDIPKPTEPSLELSTDIPKHQESLAPIIKENVRVLMPEDVSKIVKLLQERNYTVYLVGGAVRDHFLKKEANDWDLVTTAPVLELQSLLAAHNPQVEWIDSISLTAGEHNIDINSILPADPSNSIHSRLLSNSQGRDFTINALFWDPKSSEILDFHGGLADLEDHKLKMIGDPLSRMTESPVRILRALRYSCLPFVIDDSIMECSNVYPSLLARLNKFVLQKECSKLFRAAGLEVTQLLERFHLSEMLAEITQGFAGIGLSSCAQAGSNASAAAVPPAQVRPMAA